MSATETRDEAPERDTVREHLAYVVYASVAWIAKRLPTGFGRALFRALGVVGFHVAPRLRATVAANQGQVIGRPVDDPLVQASTREAFRRYARYWYDSFSIATWDEADVARHFTWEGDHYLLDPTAAGQGVIAVLPHLGNWDVQGRALLARGLPMVAVAERLRPERLFQLFVRERTANGIGIIPLGTHAGRALAQTIADGNVLALLSDRDLTGRGVAVRLFGATCRMPAGPAMLAMSTGAPVVVVGSYETPDGWHGVARPLAMPERTGDRRTDARAITQAIADAFATMIAASPADWHVFQPVWEPAGTSDDT